MDKIGQVTFCGSNYGSVLQCYATQQFWSELGYKCVLLKRRENGFYRFLQSCEFKKEQIYKYLRYPKYKSTFDSMLNIARNNTACDALMPESIEQINNFIDKNINSIEYSYKELKRIARTDSYKLFLSGSDQIWSGTWFVTNKMYFLRFSPRAKRVAWSPSFGGENIAEYNKPLFKKYINGYKYLSVREESGAKLIKELTGKPTRILFDPVILLPRKKWEELCTPKICKDKYILLFFLDKPSPTTIGMIERIKKHLSCKLIMFSYTYEKPKKTGTLEVSGGPGDFLGIIQNAEFVITDSFHASLFSIIFNKPFWVFRRNMSGLDTQTARIDNLLKNFDMSARLITAPRDVSENDFLMNPFSIEQKIKEYRDNTLNYVSTILSD